MEQRFEGRQCAPTSFSFAVLGDDARAADVEMIPDGAELALAVAAQQVLYGEVPVLAGGGAVNDDIFHLLHVRSVLDAFQQFSFARHFLIGGEQGKDSSIIG